jgi:cathepsin B
VAVHPVNQDIVKNIKAKAATWTVVEPEDNIFKNWSEDEIKGMMGTKVPDAYTVEQVTGDQGTFDARTKWPKCVHAIRNQQQCGSCWAFGATEALSDRFCIAGTDVILSPEDLVECDSTDMGCQGGYLNKAWEYLEGTGAVTDTCSPYVSGSGNTPHCLHGACTDTHIPFLKYKCTEGSIAHPRSVAAIQKEIQDNGPIEGAFTVYQDFMSYKSGVYKHTTGQ